MATMSRSLTAVVTSVAIGTPVHLNVSPLLGGQGHNAMLRIPALPLTATVLVQGAPSTSTGAVPVSGDSSWATIATVTSASLGDQEIVLPDWIRLNTTVLDADGPNVVFLLEGIQ